VQTSENAAGLTGFDEVAITFSKEVKASGGGEGSGTSINIYMPQGITGTSVDTVQYYLGKRDPLPEDPVFRELPNEPASSVFHGNIWNIEKIDATVTITKFAGLTDKKDTLTAELSYIIEGESIKIFTAEFTETNKDSNIFRTEIDFQTIEPSTTKVKWNVDKISNGEGSGEGFYAPFTMRVKGLENPEKYFGSSNKNNTNIAKSELAPDNDWYYLVGGSEQIACIFDTKEKVLVVDYDADTGKIEKIAVNELKLSANIKEEMHLTHGLQKKK